MDILFIIAFFTMIAGGLIVSLGLLLHKGYKQQREYTGDNTAVQSNEQRLASWSDKL